MPMGAMWNAVSSPDICVLVVCTSIFHFVWSRQFPCAQSHSDGEMAVRKEPVSELEMACVLTLNKN